MSRKAELSENLLATRLERFLVWAIDRRVQILTSLGVVVAAALIASVFILRRNEQLNAARTRLGYAQALISQGKYADAETVLADARKSTLDADAGRLAAYLSGVTALGKRDWDAAITHLTEAVDKSPGHPIRPLARSSLGIAFEQKRDFDAAIRAYGALVSENPDHFLAARTQLALGRCNLLAGRKDDARKALETVVDLYHSTEWAENARRLMDKTKTR